MSQKWRDRNSDPFIPCQLCKKEPTCDNYNHILCDKCQHMLNLIQTHKNQPNHLYINTKEWKKWLESNANLPAFNEKISEFSKPNFFDAMKRHQNDFTANSEYDDDEIELIFDQKKINFKGHYRNCVLGNVLFPIMVKIHLPRENLMLKCVRNATIWSLYGAGIFLFYTPSAI